MLLFFLLRSTSCRIFLHLYAWSKAPRAACMTWWRYRKFATNPILNFTNWIEEGKKILLPAIPHVIKASNIGFYIRLFTHSFINDFWMVCLFVHIQILLIYHTVPFCYPLLPWSSCPELRYMHLLKGNCLATLLCPAR